MPRTLARSLSLIVVGLLWMSPTSFSAAQDSMHAKIDQLIALVPTGTVAPPASDSEFLRRVTLDLTGLVPTAAETRTFLADKNPNKRAVLIDRLLASPRFTRHMANVFDVMLMERRADKEVPAAEWQKYLFDSFAANKPLDQLAREILGADGADAANRAPVKFYLDRQAETNLITRDVGRVFFGKDFQCAQCHDHPLIDDYVQSDYYGIYAFLNRSFLFREKGATPKDKTGKATFAEKADGDVNYSSVFTKKASQTGPRLPEQSPLAEPVVKRGEEYVVAPATDVRPIPKYSRRAQLAALATNGSSRAFNRNMANRLWALMLGRGIVEPVDLHHSDNPPSHPELLEYLTDQIVALKFDTRAFLREVALSQTYQRGYELPADISAATQLAAQQLPALQAEAAKLKAAAEVTRKTATELSAQLDAADKEVAPVFEKMSKANAAIAAAQTAADKANKPLNDAKTELVERQAKVTLFDAAVEKTKAVVAKFPDDKELATAGAVFAARAKQFQQELVGQTRKVETLTAPAKAAQDALLAAQQAATPVQQELATHQQKLDALRRQWVEVTNRSQADNRKAKHLEARLSDLKQFAQLGTATATIAQLAAAVPKAAADLKVATEAVQKLQATAPQRTQELAEAQKARDAANAAVADLQKQLAALQDGLKVATDAATQADAAKQKLPQDAELAKAAQAFATKRDQQAAALAEQQKQAPARDAAVKAAAEKFAATEKAVAMFNAELAARQQDVQRLTAQLKQDQEKLTSEKAALAATQGEVIQRLSQRFAASNLRPLSPEQIAWSIMQVTGVVEQNRLGAEAELNKKSPLDPAKKDDPAYQAQRAREIEQTIQTRIGSVGQFVNLFGAGDGQPQTDFFATVEQSLFFANGPTVRAWLNPSGENLTARLAKLDDPKALAEELYITVLTRLPTQAEIDLVTRFLTARPTEKPAVVQELAWGLITSPEFRFNH